MRDSVNGTTVKMLQNAGKNYIEGVKDILDKNRVLICGGCVSPLIQENKDLFNSTSDELINKVEDLYNTDFMTNTIIPQLQLVYMATVVSEIVEDVQTLYDLAEIHYDVMDLNMDMDMIENFSGIDFYGKNFLKMIMRYMDKSLSVNIKIPWDDEQKQCAKPAPVPKRRPTYPQKKRYGNRPRRF